MKPEDSPFEISDLRRYVAIAEALSTANPLSLRRIAETMGRSPSTITVILKQAERFFAGEGPLVKRPKKEGAATLTPRGRQMLEEAKNLLREYDRLRTGECAPLRETITIGAEVMFERHLLTHCIREFYRQHEGSPLEANVQFVVRTIDRTDPAIDMLIRNELDLLIECNLRRPNDISIVIEPPSVQDSPCEFARMVIFPSDELLQAAQLDEPTREAIKSARDAEGVTSHLDDLESIPLCFVEYDDLNAARIAGKSRARRLNLATNAAVIEFARSGWCGLTVNWRELFAPSVVGDKPPKRSHTSAKKGRAQITIGDFVVRFLTNDARGKLPDIPPLRLNIVRKKGSTEPMGVSNLSKFIEIVKREIEKIRETQLIERPMN